MLKLNNIYKSYKTGEFTQTALDGLSLNFRNNEFVAILGQSGSGKTTLLNIIGGLDQYEKGDLIINGQSTKKYKSRDWDAYRNNSVGFIFQSYNLISHLNIVDNVEMGMTLSGVSAAHKHAKAKEVLIKVGLEQHMHKKPNQLSGGQMQRVAIARALANNPDIILADEPTGALDTQTSHQILQLIKEICKDKLVIMVTHNPELASEYSDRIIKLQDGDIISDSNPYEGEEKQSDYKLKKTSMSFFTALKLSGKNIMTKKWRTALTAFASSIGIIGIALVLSLSNGFNEQISIFESGTMSNYPITISKTSMSMDRDQMNSDSDSDTKEYPQDKKIIPYDSSKNTVIHTNKISDEYMEYLENIDSSLLSGVEYTRNISMNILKSDGITATKLNTNNLNFTSYPFQTEESSESYLESNYDLLEGAFPKDNTDLVLIIDENNQLDTSILQELGFDVTAESIGFDQVIGTTYKLILNNDYYKKIGDYYTINGLASDLTTLYNNENSIPLTITGVIRIKEDANVSLLSTGLYYSDQLAKIVIADSVNSEIVLEQQQVEYNVLTGDMFSEYATNSNFGSGPMMNMNGFGNTNSTQTKDEILESLGAIATPSSISLYPVDFDSKSKVTEYLDEWNTSHEEIDIVTYTDISSIITDLSSSIMDGITLVLVAFSAISLVVSFIMIAIIIYISVMERTREIGVLRALGARKKDISRVFNAETFIIGICSGLLGILIAYLLTFPVNNIIYKLTELSDVAKLNPYHALALVILSTVLTMLGGFIPSKIAAKKDPVEALRSE